MHLELLHLEDGGKNGLPPFFTSISNFVIRNMLVFKVYSSHVFRVFLDYKRNINYFFEYSLQYACLSLSLGDQKHYKSHIFALGFYSYSYLLGFLR